MVLVGLWHGANWTYVCFGLYHGLLFIPLIYSGAFQKKQEIRVNRIGLPRLGDTLKMLLTFGLVVIGAIITRSENIGQAWEYVCGMMQFGTLKAFYRFFLPDNLLVWPTNLYIIMMLVVEWIQRKKGHGLEIKKLSCTWLRVLLYYIIIALIIFNCGEEQTFIYFQF